MNLCPFDYIAKCLKYSYLFSSHSSNKEETFELSDGRVGKEGIKWQTQRCSNQRSKRIQRIQSKFK